MLSPKLAALVNFGISMNAGWAGAIAKRKLETDQTADRSFSGLRPGRHSPVKIRARADRRWTARHKERARFDQIISKVGRQRSAQRNLSEHIVDVLALPYARAAGTPAL